MFKNINIRLLIALTSMMVFPSLYQTVRVNFLGDLPSDAGINIASQILWLSLIYEIAQEALILPLFYLFGKSLSDKNEFENKVQTGFIVILGIVSSKQNCHKFQSATGRNFSQPLCIQHARKIYTSSAITFLN